MENKDARSDQSFVASVKATGLSTAAPGFSIPAGLTQDGTWRVGTLTLDWTFKLSHIKWGTHPLQQEGSFQRLPGY